MPNICPICNGYVDGVGDTYCELCKINGLISERKWKAVQKKEMYKLDNTVGHENATRQAVLDIEHLDNTPDHLTQRAALGEAALRKLLR